MPPTTPSPVDDSDFLLQSFMALTKPRIRKFLEEHDLALSGTKAAIRARIEDAVRSNSVSTDDLIRELDEVVPWSKQHVFLFNGPSQIPAAFQDARRFAAHLARHNVAHLLNAHVPLLLPSDLTLSSIELGNPRLRVLAVQRRDYTVREPDLDESAETDDGSTYELRAFLRGISRGLVVFEWNVVANNATLQITELPSESKYEEVCEQFANLVGPWLNMGMFAQVSIRKAISKLHELEESNTPEARSHGIQYRTPQGRTLIGRSSTSSESVLGEAFVDNALRTARKKGVGHQGNFYWLPSGNSAASRNPLDDELHVVLIGDKDRVSFKKHSTEPVIRYVLSRVRTLSR
jgi:hypothetical protein